MRLSVKIFITFLAFVLAPSMVVAEAKGEAGFVIATRGEVVAVDGKGSSRILTRRSKFFAEDTIKTGPNGSAQLRFRDRALLRLKPGSSLRVDEYHYGGEDDSANTVIMNLIVGGFRTISGAIGKVDRSDYVVNTPAATIGIRGTDYEVLITEDNELHTVVWSGGISLRNELGEVDIGLGSDFSYAKVSRKLPPQGSKDVPEELFNQNELPPIPEEENESSEAEDESASETDESSTEDGDTQAPTSKHGTRDNTGINQVEGNGFDDHQDDFDPAYQNPQYDPANYASPDEFQLLVLPNGVVVELPSEKIIGILDFETNEICLVEDLIFDPSGSVIHGPTNKVLGYIDENEDFVSLLTNPDVLGGVILDANGEVVGFIGENGELILLNSDPNQNGGVVLSPDGEIKGFIDENGVFTPAVDQSGQVGEPVGSFAFLSTKSFSTEQRFGFVARFENGDTVFVYENAQGVEKYVPFNAEVGALVPAQHPSIEWGRWTTDSVLLAQQNGHFPVTQDPEFYWIDVIPYDPGSNQARTGLASFSLTQMEAGGKVTDSTGVLDELNLGSSSGTMMVNFDTKVLAGDLNFNMESSANPANNQQVEVDFNGTLYSPSMNVTNAQVTNVGGTSTVNAVVNGVVTDSADAFGGAVTVSNGKGLGEADAIGIRGVFIMEE